MFVPRCLCCEHENRAGDRFCERCGSTLNLKLCAQCEAINESRALRCHHCDNPFPAEPPADQPVHAASVARGQGVPGSANSGLLFALLIAAATWACYILGRKGPAPGGARQRAPGRLAMRERVPPRPLPRHRKSRKGSREPLAPRAPIRRHGHVSITLPRIRKVVPAAERRASVA